MHFGPFCLDIFGVWETLGFWVAYMTFMDLYMWKESMLEPSLIHARKVNIFRFVLDLGLVFRMTEVYIWLKFGFLSIKNLFRRFIKSYSLWINRLNTFIKWLFYPRDTTQPRLGRGVKFDLVRDYFSGHDVTKGRSRWMIVLTVDFLQLWLLVKLWWTRVVEWGWTSDW